MFSVVMPVYNHAPYLVEAVHSALRSSLVTEVLMVDDGSKDVSRQVISQLAKRYPERVRDLSDPDSGNLDAPGRYNQLIPQCKNRWISILNSDDAFAAGRFEVLAPVISRDGVEFAFGNLLVCNTHGEVFAQKRAFIDPEYPFETTDGEALNPQKARLTSSLLCQNFIATTSNMVFTKELFQKVGGFRKYRYCHDWDFAIRATLVGVARYIPTPLALYRVHSSNTISENAAAVKSEVRGMFDALRADVSSLDEDQQYAPWLRSNRYLASFSNGCGST